MTRKPEIRLAGQLPAAWLPGEPTRQLVGGTCQLLLLTSWPWARSACKARHLQLRDQFTGATSAFTPWTKFSRLLAVLASLTKSQNLDLLAMQWFICLLPPLLVHANAHTQLGGHPMPHAQLVPRLPVIYPRPVFYHGGVQHPEIWSLGPVLEKLLKFSCPEVFCQILNARDFPLKY